VPYVSVEHQPGVWVNAHIEKQWKHEGRWRLSCYYFVDTVQHYRVFDAYQVRPVIPAQDEQDEQRRARHRKADRHDDVAGHLASVVEVQERGRFAPSPIET
jgi:hypothetical protein